MTLFQKTLYSWYEENRRDLPWRNTSDPYRIWISEVILQQTRVLQGLEYYNRFIGYFPDLKSLAEADEHEVLKQWQGLGYYSRARNLHSAAKTILKDLNGIFPGDYNTMIRLKGIGEYTAAAISSISFGLPFPVIDGNVNRFLSRYFEISEPIDSSTGKKNLTTLAHELLDKDNPGQYNQAVMEFGALQCVPVNPDCNRCVFSSSCLALKNQRVRDLPIKQKKAKVTDRFFHYFLFEKDSSVFIQKRTRKDIWRNLYQLPLIETESDTSVENLLTGNGFGILTGEIPVTLIHVSKTYRHILSHRQIFARFYRFSVPGEFQLQGDFVEILKKDIAKFAVPRLIEIYLTDQGFLEVEKQ